jgi:hypothetical protein
MAQAVGWQQSALVRVAFIEVLILLTFVRYWIDPSGRSQWEPPAFSPPPMGGPPGQYGLVVEDMEASNANIRSHDQNRGAEGYGQHGQGYPGQYPGYGVPGYGPGQQQEKKGMNPMMAGVAGAAVGAAGGAWIAHEMTEDEHGNQVAQTSYASAPPGSDPSMYGGPGGVPPPPPEADPNLSGSDREDIGEAGDDVRDAQQDYNEALASGSSSDIEEAREDLADAHEGMCTPLREPLTG